VGHVEPAHLDEHVLELVNVSVTETVSERNVEMTVVTLETFVTSVVLLKSVEVTFNVLVSVHPTAEILMDPKEFVVTMDVSDLVVNVLELKVKISDAETDNVSVALNVMFTPVGLMVAEELVELVLVMLNVSMELVSIPLQVAVETVFDKPH